MRSKFALMYFGKEQRERKAKPDQDRPEVCSFNHKETENKSLEREEKGLVLLFISNLFIDFILMAAPV